MRLRERILPSLVSTNHLDSLLHSSNFPNSKNLHRIIKPHTCSENGLSFTFVISQSVSSQVSRLHNCFRHFSLQITYKFKSPVFFHSVVLSLSQWRQPQELVSSPPARFRPFTRVRGVWQRRRKRRRALQR